MFRAMYGAFEKHVLKKTLVGVDSFGNKYYEQVGVWPDLFVLSSAPQRKLDGTCSHFMSTSLLRVTAMILSSGW